MVWDTIYRTPQSEPVEEWGGIAFALAALDVTLPEGWTIVPLIKVGSDLARPAKAFLETLDRCASSARFVEVPEPNNRVTLRYQDHIRRTEQLRGGVPPWQWHELGPMVTDLDAIYCNMISGFELDLNTAQHLRQVFHGPIYADMHSLTLDTNSDGMRVPHKLAEPAEWFRCFDVVQANEEEITLLGGEPMQVAAHAMAQGVQLLVVTLGASGAVYFAQEGFMFAQRQHTPSAQPIRTAKLAGPVVEDVRDPTGCGDVFGAALVSFLLQQEEIESAIRRAQVLAARNVQYHGATHLKHHLRGELLQR